MLRQKEREAHRLWEPRQQKSWLTSPSLVLLLMHRKGQADFSLQPSYAICLRSLISIIKVAVMQLNADRQLSVTHLYLVICLVSLTKGELLFAVFP